MHRGSRDRETTDFTPLERNDAVIRLNAVLAAERLAHDQTKVRGAGQIRIWEIISCVCVCVWRSDQALSPIDRIVLITWILAIMHPFPYCCLKKVTRVCVSHFIRSAISRNIFF